MNLTTTIDNTVAADLLSVAAEIEVSSDGLTASVRGETLEADSFHQLTGRLAATLYQLLHIGREKLDTARPRTFRDPHLETLLTEATPHEMTRTDAVLSAKVGDDAFIAVLDGVRVLLPASDVRGSLPDLLPATAAVQTPTARPALSAGFFLVDGSSGTQTGTGSHTLRLYVNLTHADAAPAAWRTVLSALEDRRVRYRAKITSATSMFPRQDALVVYLGPDAWHAVPAVADSVSGLSGVGTTVSPFTHVLAPGISVAWEPQDDRPGMRRMSFGEHRAGALAESAVKHAMRSDGVGLADTLAESLIDAGIDPLAAARNMDSPALVAVRLV